MEYIIVIGYSNIYHERILKGLTFNGCGELEESAIKSLSDGKYEPLEYYTLYELLEKIKPKIEKEAKRQTIDFFGPFDNSDNSQDTETQESNNNDTRLWDDLTIKVLSNESTFIENFKVTPQFKINQSEKYYNKIMRFQEANNLNIQFNYLNDELCNIIFFYIGPYAHCDL